jgi:2-polyprenyl-3-methyl-5-hydroxy-6-metoxy-1,4-benzoquinol methylase
VQVNRHAFFGELARAERPLAFRPEHEPRIERLRRRLEPLRGKRVYEPGCGAGPLTERLAEWVGESGRVLAVDACPGMVAHCGKAVAGHRHVRLERGKAEETALERGEWELVVCFRTYPHLEEPERFLERCREGLAPGGELVIANLEGSRLLNELHSRLAGVEGDVMPSGDALASRLRAAGWSVEEAIDEPDDYFVRARWTGGEP